MCVDLDKRNFDVIRYVYTYLINISVYYKCGYNIWYIIYIEIRVSRKIIIIN